MIFEWDESKRSENLRRHGFDFADCSALFDGPIITMPDVRFDYGERRFKAYASLYGRVIVVAYAEVAEAVRVISMRKATKREEAHYFEDIQN